MSSAPRAIRIALDGLLLWLGFFAGWSLVSIPLTLTCSQLEWLWLAFGSGIVGATLALTALRMPLSPVLLQPANAPWQISAILRTRAWLWAGSLVALTLLAALFFVPTSNALPLWCVIILLAIASLLKRDNHIPSRPLDPSYSGAAGSGLTLEISIRAD